jgi:hypothetical protein
LFDANTPFSVELAVVVAMGTEMLDCDVVFICILFIFKVLRFWLNKPFAIVLF